MLVIFDCDGVLVDSEIVSARVFSECLHRVDIVFSKEHCLEQFKGWTLLRCYSWLEQHFDTALPSHFDDMLSEATFNAFSNELYPVKNVKVCIESLISKNIPYCMASNGGHEKINRSLMLTGLDTFFSSSQRFSSDDVEEGKPSPLLFLHAAESMGVPAQFCWVIEDSLSGCIAAKHAGMRLIYFQHTLNTPDDIDSLQPEYVSSSMQDIHVFLNALHGGVK